MAWVIWFTILGMLPADNWNAPKEAVAISTVSFKVEPVAVASKVTDSKVFSISAIEKPAWARAVAASVISIAVKREFSATSRMFSFSCST